MSFLNAEWRKLIIANYTISPEILSAFIPKGTELDLWQGKCYVSIVGFMFKNTKILGLKIPFHVNFEEVNLRFYVKKFEAGEWRRGVVFIKEIVPKIAISFVANTIYKEHYETCSMRHKWLEEKDKQYIQYEWYKNNTWQSISVEASTKEMAITENTEPYFITEHYWGYTKMSETKTSSYEVTHPSWVHYPILKYHIDIDFKACYGQQFAFLKAFLQSAIMHFEP